MKVSVKIDNFLILILSVHFSIFHLRGLGLGTRNRDSDVDSAGKDSDYTAVVATKEQPSNNLNTIANSHSVTG